MKTRLTLFPLRQLRSGAGCSADASAGIVGERLFGHRSGYATNIPPHNLRETIDACVHALEHPDCSVDDLIALISAPDFPTGGIVYGLSGVYEGYRTGRGRVIMRARTHLEEFGRDHSRTRIVVDEIPYMVNKRVL